MKMVITKLFQQTSHCNSTKYKQIPKKF